MDRCFSTQPTIFSRIFLCHIFQEASLSFSRSPVFLCLSTLFIANGSFDISRMGLPFLHHGLQESICFLDVSRMLLLSLSAFSQQLLMVLLTSDIWFLLLFLLSTITIQPSMLGYRLSYSHSSACRAEQRQLQQRMFWRSPLKEYVSRLLQDDLLKKSISWICFSAIRVGCN